MPNNTLLLSVRPEYACKIFDGSKKVELRRTRPRVKSGDLVLVYVSSPVKALFGAFEVDYIVESSPHDLWQSVKNKAGITYDQFIEYYDGAELGFGIFLKHTCCLPEPINLNKLRTLWVDFSPPQSYRYITPDELQILSNSIDKHCTVFNSKIKNALDLPEKALGC